MCSVCGCGGGPARLDGGNEVPRAAAPPPPVAPEELRWRLAPAPPAAAMADVPAEVPSARLLAVEADILGANDARARANRARLGQAGSFALNLVSSPGSGKTTLLCETLRRLRGERPLAVIEGDQQTSLDAERVRATGVPAVQVNTGKGCHLDADMVARALERLPLAAGGLLFIENVGNLVCPAAFDLGEQARVAILAVTEGEDKPLKYPELFASADLLLLNKIDLLPYVDFDLARCRDYARRVNPDVAILEVSARTGAGLDAWLDWLRAAAAG
ncbi:hydrogenase nickel incorporation protein HypB [Plasticicumulans lactativorans]|uniref:Hydrogenase maturation factor HypB n=1 Tax=Plasticicumulans lactativorans TaxID=1133106 RepID=A0A4R2KQ27_9GAMM|nr:hydrogenase nickel incorporation protein HypB [Plasticicumulans lactativorans]TCO76351.1 hydrogenase nickel incorporation protein HypB [Plasticicumulans lactativorans]